MIQIIEIGTDDDDIRATAHACAATYPAEDRGGKEMPMAAVLLLDGKHNGHVRVADELPTAQRLARRMRDGGRDVSLKWMSHRRLDAMVQADRERIDWARQISGYEKAGHDLRNARGNGSWWWGCYDAFQSAKRRFHAMT